MTSRSKAQPLKGGGMDVRKSEDSALWYSTVLQKAELIEDYPVKGCFILRPWAYKIWELIQQWLDVRFKQLGVENCYFPMFIPNQYLTAEKNHLEDFAPEIAMVTKCGDKDIEQPVAIRPTSETAMYAAFHKWIQSHKDLPLKLNQWCNVVRWEVKSTLPFFRHREFLWQEGHTAFADKASAEQEVLQVLELYASVYEHLMAVPCVRGYKTRAETFPGAEYTASVEVFIPATGRALQGGTSHHLGQTFSKPKDDDDDDDEAGEEGDAEKKKKAKKRNRKQHPFEISFQHPTDGTTVHAYQNSWGISTRSMAALIMVHGDDKGLVLPPKLAGHQVVILPVGLGNKKCTETDREQVHQKCSEYCDILSSAGVRVKVDNTDQSPGWKAKQWEMKGVPLLLEVGPRDFKGGKFVMTKRTASDPKTDKIAGEDGQIVEQVKDALDEIHDELFSKALADRDAHLVAIDKWADLNSALNSGNLVLIPFCGNPACEAIIKKRTKEEAEDVEVPGGLTMGAKSLCVPFEDKYSIGCPENCINPECTNVGKDYRRTLFGRSY